MANRKYFGTDGIRGTANTAPMTAEVAMKVGMAAGTYFKNGGHRHRVVIGKDTRLSGYMIEPALTAGFVSVGMDVTLVGPVPTPAVAMLVRSLRADLGVVISASHNPYLDNGIKLFNSKGNKLSDDIEQEIEDLMDNSEKIKLADPDKLGRAKRLEDEKGRYIEFLKQGFPKKGDLEGLKIVVDAANGAAYKIAPAVLWELGAEVIAIGVDPNGTNINDGCGSTHTELLSKTVIENNADIGIALDGDADRLIIVDETGKTIDGDKIIGLIATHLHEKGKLKKDTVVVTAMSNLGLDMYLQTIGIAVKRTGVGDRYVVEEMRNNGYNLGGEQSGHIIMGDLATTGDGTMAALQVLTVLCDERAKNPKAKLSTIMTLFDTLPQVLKNYRYKPENKATILEDEGVKKAIADGEQALNGKGRVFIRRSGTEPLIRVMIEGESDTVINEIVEKIVEAIKIADK